MNTSHPIATAEWREFLQTYSTEFLNSDHLRGADRDWRAQRKLRADQREAGWLGFEPASEDTVLAAERRLGVQLPPSYRNFLLTSNGWSSMSCSPDLLDVDRVGWFPDLVPNLFAAWSDPGLEYFLPPMGQPHPLLYTLDPSSRGSSDGRFADQLSVLERCLVISSDDDGCGDLWLLHADDIDENGEWTAYEWWTGNGEDPISHDSFAALAAKLWHDAALGLT